MPEGQMAYRLQLFQQFLIRSSPWIFSCDTPVGFFCLRWEVHRDPVASRIHSLDNGNDSLNREQVIVVMKCCKLLMAPPGCKVSWSNAAWVDANNTPVGHDS